MSKYCKKCGKEIPQDSKVNICENCQNRANGVIRKIGESVGVVAVFVGGAVLAAIIKGKLGGPKV